ncbi:hypothetical protein Anapl_10537 [Anas platyrhynchos]|uniref:Uncharacterized protein n=1 Tax=Anas platyrhynchos TaxID=8839 RepID=R0JJJ0_ANAPL|nr:hypothetical protein Anapl_10537 [Anas platyrhynchos]
MMLNKQPQKNSRKPQPENFIEIQFKCNRKQQQQQKRLRQKHSEKIKYLISAGFYIKIANLLRNNKLTGSARLSKLLREARTESRWKWAHRSWEEAQAERSGAAHTTASRCSVLGFRVKLIHEAVKGVQCGAIELEVKCTSEYKKKGREKEWYLCADSNVALQQEPLKGLQFFLPYGLVPEHVAEAGIPSFKFTVDVFINQQGQTAAEAVVAIQSGKESVLTESTNCVLTDCVAELMVCVKIVLETKECTTNYVKSDKAVLKSKKTCKGTISAAENKETAWKNHYLIDQDLIVQQPSCKIPKVIPPTQ